MVTKIQFLLFYSIFLFFLMQISVMAGESIVSGINAPIPPKPPSAGGGEGIIGFFDSIISIMAYVFRNIAYFFSLMNANSTFRIFGAVVLTPFVIVLIWIILELIKPFGGGGS